MFAFSDNSEFIPQTLLSRKETAAKLDIGTSLEEPLLSSIVNSALQPQKTLTKNRHNVDVQTMFAEQSFFAQLDSGQDNEESPKTKPEEKVETKVEEPGQNVFSPPWSPDKSGKVQRAEDENSNPTNASNMNNNKLSPLKPLSSLKDLPQLQPPSKLPSKLLRMSLQIPNPRDHIHVDQYSHHTLLPKLIIL